MSFKLHVFSTGMYASITWTIRKPKRDRQEYFEILCNQRIMKLKWTYNDLDYAGDFSNIEKFACI